jgi:hypothetical protein
MREQALIVVASKWSEFASRSHCLGLDTDNDSAFMNDTLWDYCQEYDLVFTRSRAYRKNDQAWGSRKMARSSGN